MPSYATLAFPFNLFIAVTFKMKVKINGKSVIVKGKTVKDALNSAKINPETVLVKRKGRLIAQDETLKDNDVLELIAVISGG